MTPLSTDNINIPPERIVSWMNTLRSYSFRKEQFRILENFWESQIKSKVWLIQNIKNKNIVLENSTVYIMGGWYGLLAQFIVDNFNVQTVISIDIDKTCLEIGSELCSYDNRIKFIQGDMKNFGEDGEKILSKYSSNTSLIINTSTEHITQEIYNSWCKQLPKEVFVVLQGNNLYDCSDHIRCTNTLKEFVEKNPLDSIIFSDELNCGGFNRYMTIGKNYAL